MHIEVLDADEWEVLRCARLTALRDTPTAFLGDHASESVRSESEWRATFNGSKWIVAREQRDVVALARSLKDTDAPAQRHIESVWVAPRHRRAGVLRAVLEFILQTEQDVDVWLMWVIKGHVIDGTTTARAVYERLGFESTGECQPLPDGSGRIEELLELKQIPRP